MTTSKKEAALQGLLPSFRFGVVVNTAALGALAGASVQSDKIFTVGIAAALAIGVYNALHEFRTHRHVFTPFLGALFGAVSVIFSFAYLGARAAFIVALGFSSFLIFVTSSAAIEQKTFKDGFKSVLRLLIIAFVAYLLGVLFGLIF